MDICKPVYSLLLQPDEDILKPIKLIDDRSYFRNLKRTKRISRDVAEVLFELEDDEVALVGATFGSTKNPSIIVYRMTCMSTVEPNPVGALIYICAKKDGLYYYPEDTLKEMLQQKETVYYLQDYKDHQAFVWGELQDIVDEMNRTFKGG